jgi:hypothetical protein
MDLFWKHPTALHKNNRSSKNGELKNRNEARMIGCLSESFLTFSFAIDPNRT